jgi:hypothetical protein
MDDQKVRRAKSTDEDNTFENRPQVYKPRHGIYWVLVILGNGKRACIIVTDFKSPLPKYIFLHQGFERDETT